MTRIEELKLAIDDGVASESDVLEYDELKRAVECVVEENEMDPQSRSETAVLEKSKSPAMDSQLCDFDSWLDANTDRVDSAWREHQAETRGSVTQTINSDKGWREFAEAMFEREGIE